MPQAAFPDRLSALSVLLAKHRSTSASAAVLACLLALAACSSGPTAERGTHGSIASRNSSGERGYRTKLDGWGPKAPPSGFPKFIDHSVGQEEVSMQAMGLVGVPYQWGGNTPATGFDCSGLVRYVVARAADVILPRTTGQMSKVGESVSPSEIAPGDLIFFNTDGGKPYSHVGIYVGDYRFVNAPSTGGTVRIDYVTNPYWAKHFDGIRRVAGLNTAPIMDTPNTPVQPPASIMPPRALASETDSAPVITDPIALEIARADREEDMRGKSNVYAHNVDAMLPASAPTSVPTVPRASSLPVNRQTFETPQRIVTSGRIVTPPIATGNNDDDPIARLARGY